jgi:hypothetical protein
LLQPTIHWNLIANIGNVGTITAKHNDVMARNRRYPFRGGPSRIPVNKGSRKRLLRITLRGNGSVGLWVAALTVILAFILLLPLAVEHAARHYLH